MKGMRSVGSSLGVVASAWLGGCAAMGMGGRLMVQDAPLPAEVRQGETVGPFRVLAASTDLRQLRDDQGDERLPRDATDARWYVAGEHWEAGRNDLGVLVSRYASGVLAYRRPNGCFWTWQNFQQSYMGGSSYGAASPIAMQHGQTVFTYPCPPP